MIKHDAASPPVADPSASTSASVLGWLRAKLAPHGDDLLNWVSYVMIVGAMALLVLWQQNLVAWRLYGALGALSVLLVMNTPLWAEKTGISADEGSSTYTWLFFTLSAVLVLSAFVLGGGGRFSFVPYLLFMLAGQATATARFRSALLYSTVLLVGFVGILWLGNADRSVLLSNVITVSMGMVFVMLFTIVTVRYGEQTARAEALLAELREANAELAAARERERDLAIAEERVRLARDIHDGLGHHLTVLSVQLQAAAKVIETDPAHAVATIETCRDVAQAALQEVRQSISALRRTPLDDRPIDEAIRSMVEQFDMHAPVAARFEVHGTPISLVPSAAMTLYRAAQEGLTNVQKHAQAQRATVMLRFDPEHVRLSVTDDGVGPKEHGSGFGLAGLRERAEQLGGTLAAGSLPQGGFRMELTIPTG